MLGKSLKERVATELANLHLRWVRYDFLSNDVSFRRKEWTTSITVWAWSSVPSSSPPSAEALAPMSVHLGQYPAIYRGRKRDERTNVVHAQGDLLAVGFVDGAIDLLQVVRVGDDLVIGDEVLQIMSVSATLADLEHDA
jgi:hypothetical protein